MKCAVLVSASLISCFALSSCSGGPEAVKLNPETDCTYISPKPVITDLDPAELTKDDPSPLLVKMAGYLDSMGYAADTIRAKKVGYATRTEKLFFKSMVFYKQPVPPPHLFDTRGRPQGYDGIDTTTIRKDLFSKATSLISYCYFEKHPDDDLVRDGVIDEWRFETKEDAEKAGLEMNRIKRLIYFYTAAYVARHENVVYVFHNRAAFDRLHRKTLRRFKDCFDNVYPDQPNRE